MDEHSPDKVSYNVIMAPALDQALRRDFQHLTTVTDPTVPFATEGFGVYDGWEPLLRRLLTAIEGERRRLPAADAERVRLCQVKQKWDGLRVYVSGATPAMQQLLDRAEMESFGVCDRCGATDESAPSSRGQCTRATCPSRRGE